MENEFLNRVINQHQCALKGFKSGYCFSTKQRDIEFRLECSLRKLTSEQLTDQNKVAALVKKMEKRQKEIDQLNSYLEIAKTVTEDDILGDNVGKES